MVAVCAIMFTCVDFTPSILEMVTLTTIAVSPQTHPGVLSTTVLSAARDCAEPPKRKPAMTMTINVATARRLFMIILPLAISIIIIGNSGKSRCFHRSSPLPLLSAL
jgi:hypothetical protein